MATSNSLALCSNHEDGYPKRMALLFFTGKPYDRIQAMGNERRAMPREQASIQPVRVIDMPAISQMTQANMTGIDPWFTNLVRRPFSRWLTRATLPFYFMFSGRGFKAVKGGRILGFAFLALRRRSGYVFNVNVNRPFRRQGVGQLLMYHLEQVTRERRRSWTVLQVDEPNLPARRLYEKIGYRAYHPDLLRHQKPALMPIEVTTGIAVRPLSGHQGQRLFKKYQAAEQEAGDSWAADAVAEYSLIPSDVRYWRCLVQGQEIGCAWMSLPSRHQMVAGLALKPEFWGHFAVLKLLRLLFDEVRPQPQRFDVYLASSQNHQMARPLFENLGFQSALQARILMLKALA